jgi:serine protease Do
MCLAVGLVGPAAFGQPVARARNASGVEAPQTPYLGVGGQDITSDRAKALKLKEERGAEVTKVDPDSAAAKAGIKEGDVVLEFNGEKVEGWVHLQRLVHETPIRREVKISVWRNGAVQTLTAVVGARRELPMDSSGGSLFVPRTFTPPMPAMPAAPPMPQLDIPQFRTLMNTTALGIVGESLGQESQLAEFFGVKEGVLVREVTKGSAADKAGMKAGDVITRIDDTAISSPQQIFTALRAARSKGTANVTVVRSKKEISLSVTIDAGGAVRGGVDFNIPLRLFLNPGQRATGIFWL